MNISLKKTVVAMSGAMLAGAMGTAAAHDIDEAGEPVCTEANYMMADAQNTPFGDHTGPGRVIEMNIVTGTPGITVGNPFNPGNANTAICPDDVICPAAWKPTGVLSGGENGHAFITSAGQIALTQFHRDGTPIRTTSFKSLLGNPTTGGPPMPGFPGGVGFASLPRPLGTQLMPNGNLIQAICDANFFNAFNSDGMGAGESGISYAPVNGGAVASSNNSSWLYFPPVYATDDRHTRPAEGEPGHDLWGCMAGIMFSDEGMYVSTFHGGAVLEIDWKAGVEDDVAGTGSNDTDNDFEVDHGDGSRKKKGGNNRAVVTDVIDFRLGEPENNSGWRRDSLRAISFDESGNIYATDRERSEECVRGQAPGAVPAVAPPCNPRVFRQRVNIASFDGYNNPALRRTLALDPGVNVIAGIRTNRMSRTACDYVQANAATYATEYSATGYAAEEDLCDVETLLVASSAMNPGCDANGDGLNGPGHPANQCFKPGGSVAEYIIHPNFTDGGAAYGGDTCTGNPADELVGGANAGCAQPVAMFDYTSPDGGAAQAVDPRMLMVIHEAFGQ